MKEILRYLERGQDRFLGELTEWLSIPSVSTKPEHKKDVRAAGEWAIAQLQNCGLEEIKLNETDGHPIVTARTALVNGAPTVLVYGHYDVQPPEPLELWTTDPFGPTVRNGKVFARGSADDKGQVFIYLKVLEAFKKVRGSFPVNVKLLIEGEEEIGSPNLVPFLKANKKELACDVVLVSDTHMIGLKTPSITTALRGLSYIEVTVTGAKGDLHSGSFGGAIPNPAQVLAEMLVACKHPKTGRILIPGFYDDVRKLTRKEKASMAAIPHDDRKFARSVGAPAVYGEKGFSTLERIGSRPTFEVNGIWSGYIGEGLKTVLPSEAHAKISMRLVADQDPRKIMKLAEAHLKEIAPPYVKVKVKRSSNQAFASRVDPDFPAMKVAAEAVKKVFGKEPVYSMEGGSIPIVAEFKRILRRETILLGFGLPDDNLHAPNEKFDLRMLEKGMKTGAWLLEGLSK